MASPSPHHCACGDRGLRRHLRGDQLPPLAPVAPLALALFFVGVAGNRTHTLATAIGTIAIVAAVEFTSVDENFDGLDLLADVTLVLVPLVVGDAARSRRDYVAALIERAEDAERAQRHRAERLLEQQRLEIARELHDVVAHTMTVVNVRAGVAAHLLPDDPDQAREALETIRVASADAINEIRGLIGVLRTEPAAPETGLVRAPAPGLADLPALVETFRTEGMAISTELDTCGARVPDSAGLATYRLVQEACRNAALHGGSAPLLVRVRLDDVGLGVDVTQQPPPGSQRPVPRPGAGVGLIGVRERVEALGGTMDAGRTSTGGFYVAARLPLSTP